MPDSPAAKRKLIGFKQRIQINEQRAREKAGRPDPWVTRKFFVAAVYALVVYAYYVFVGRLCVPMLQRKGDARGSVGEGAGLLVGFNVLWLMFIWTYSRIAFTSPGWATQAVPKAAEPEDSMITTTNTGTPYQYLGTQTDTSTPIQPSDHTTDESSHMTPAQRYASIHARSRTSLMSRTSIGDRDPSDLDAARNMLPAEIPLFGQDSRRGETADSRKESALTDAPGTGGISNGDHRVSDLSQTGTLDSCTPLKPIPASDPPIPDRNPLASQNDLNANVAQPNPIPTTGVPSKPAVEWLYDRPLPPWYPGLAYCRYCKIYKPQRTHHCRHCGTCVLAMDHHCPWIGQCVGWQNHKFFIIFCGWSSLFTAYIAIVLAVKMGTQGSLDGQMLAVVIVGGFFTVFTVAMTFSHIAMACSALTTLESFSIRDQRDRESHLLAQKYGFFKWRTKHQTLKRWNHEYGDLKTEGNRWYVGGPGREWRQLMGDDPIGWILPLGHSKGNGAHWEQNPRFGPNGERRKRQEWPEHLR
ncbi:hypothetical protein NliqN6_3661 [Naganishia liquefaciens]|uniref:Palmitoyltransferase n=1 Tax=Naganishia liquefaciens TaxID=104408 RepID=A0A8H3TW27_9TREE|nr:hypothetical protein NliqN6_3661 [Naganishia liquefaciens]